MRKRGNARPALIKGHKTVKCAQCHLYDPDTKTTHYKDTPMECGDRCHEDSLHKGSLGDTCSRCHSPGMRSGFVAGDPAIIKKFLLYRTYCGGAMSPPVQAASIAAWGDEAHVQENRVKYREKFSLVTPMLKKVMDVELPDAGFYLWADVRRTGLTDTEFARRLYVEYNVTVLPGSYLAREAHGINPGQNRIRMALVAEVDEGVEAAQRIVQFCTGLKKT